MGFQPMNHRQDADATIPHGQDAHALERLTTSLRTALVGPGDDFAEGFQLRLRLGQGVLQDLLP